MKSILIQTLEFPDIPEPSKEEIIEMMKGKYAYVFEGIFPLNAKEENKGKEKSTEQGKNSYAIFMEFNRDFPARSGKEISEALGAGFSTANIANISKEAEEKQEAKKISIPRLRKPIQVLQFTGLGEQNWGKQKTKKGSIVHYRYQYIDIPAFLENLNVNYEVEYPLNSQQSTDIAVTKGSKRLIAIEIELSPKHAIENIKKNIADFSLIISVFEDEKHLTKIRNEFNQRNSKVKFCLLKHFLDLNNKELRQWLTSSSL